MKEDFLHYVWQHQYFDKTDLITEEGEPVTILKTGMANFNAGPDFLGASLQLGSVTWNGSVEIHLKASDWLRHEHQTDPRYDQVILHVVWEADQVIARTDNSPIPTLALQQRVQPALLQAYTSLKKEKGTIPCAPLLPQVPEMPKLVMLNRVLVERLEQKASGISDMFTHNNHDWEITAYEALLAAFGFKINQEPFRRLSQVLPFSIIRKYKQHLFQLEALIFGQAGFLSDPIDDYLTRLSKEHKYLQHKHALPAPLPTAAWNFLRLRPANFPTVRLAQLAAILQGKDHLFSSFISFRNIDEYFNFFEAEVSEYWQKHYMPGRVGKKNNGSMGKESKAIIVINTVVPLLFAYARQTDNQLLHDKALSLLDQIKAEHNQITSIYEDLGVPNKSAADSQSFLQLYQHYCLPRRCLSCSIGHHILKSNLITS